MQTAPEESEWRQIRFSAICELVAFAPTTDPERARAFYEGVLGLQLVADEKPFALVFDANGTMPRVTTVHELTPHPFTVLGWHVRDIEAIWSTGLRPLAWNSIAIRE